MKLAALDIYVCPACHGALTLESGFPAATEVLEGTLLCATCGTRYPIVRGVPRFVRAGAYATSFGRQWNWFRKVQIDSHNRNSESMTTFRESTGWREGDLNGRKVLDAGVGAGRFAECAVKCGGEVFGVDLTRAVDAAFANIGREPRVNIAQADIFSLPFRPGTFDCGYSIGVLHHTPDPEAAFGRVADAIRPGGELAIYVYSRYGPGHRWSDLIRKVTTRMPAPIMLGLSAGAVPMYYAYKVPLIGRVLRLAVPASEHPDWRWRWLDTFDWYTPKYQFKYLYPEIYRWYSNAGFRDMVIFDDPIRMRGVKAPEAATHATDSAGRVVAS